MQVNIVIVLLILMASILVSVLGFMNRPGKRSPLPWKFYQSGGSHPAQEISDNKETGGLNSIDVKRFLKLGKAKDSLKENFVKLVLMAEKCPQRVKAGFADCDTQDESLSTTGKDSVTIQSIDNNLPPYLMMSRKETDAKRMEKFHAKRKEESDLKRREEFDSHEDTNKKYVQTHGEDFDSKRKEERQSRKEMGKHPIRKEMKLPPIIGMGSR